jgi:hypothetical protein
MKRIICPYLARTVLGALVLLTTTAHGKSGCSVATLKGDYAMTFSGFAVINNYRGGRPRVPDSRFRLRSRHGIGLHD